MKKIFPILLTASLVVACQEQQPTAISDDVAISFAIYDGASGGNPDFFFYPPLADSPTGNENFDAGEFNEYLSPFVRICSLESDPPFSPSAPCANLDPTLAMDVDGGVYKVNWHTSDFGLNDDEYYRINVYVGSESEIGLLGFRDVLALSGPPVASCSTDDPICQFNNGSTLPIKVRIENYAFCPVARDCQTQSFDLAGGVSFNLQDQFLLNVPNQPESKQGTVTFRPCVDDNTADFIDIPLFGDCMETVLFSGEPIELGEDFTATISFCDVDLLQDYGPGTADNLSAAQVTNLRVHHFRGANGDQGVEALRVANDCPQDIADARSNPIERFASRILSWITPRPLQAAAVAGKGGFGGNSLETIGSKFRIGLPAKIDFVDVADATRLAATGSTLLTQAKVTDLNGEAVKDATVRWNVDRDGSEGADVWLNALVQPTSSSCKLGSETGDPDEVVCVTDANGEVEVDWLLSTEPGINKLKAGGRGIADDRDGFNGPRDASYSAGAFDPFQPIAFDENLADGIESPEDEISAEIAEETRLLFTAIGCEPGFGTPNDIDGVMEDGEWDCAVEETFQVNLSGGSTVDATLYYMNDTEAFHLAVVVPGTGRQNGLRVEWDNNGNGNAFGREVGDDVWEFEPDGGPADKFVDDKCSTSSQSSCGRDDLGLGGDNQTTAAFENSVGDQTVYEMSHPLKTGDKCTDDSRKGCGAALNEFIDLQRMVDDPAGFFLTLRLGSGAQGNTQWPGFLEYEPIVIK